MSTVTVELLQPGGLFDKMEVDLDLITEYGCYSVAKEIQPAFPYADIIPEYVAIGKTCYIKIYPSSLEMYITPESYERVCAAKKAEQDETR